MTKEFKDKIQKTKEKLEQVQIKISKCKTLSNKIKTTKSENKDTIEDVLVIVRRMIQQHTYKERFNKNKTNLILHQNNLDVFAKKTGLRKDELAELFERENLDVEISQY